MTKSRLLFVLGAAAATLFGCKAGERTNNNNNSATITVTPVLDTLTVGTQGQLTATARDANGTVITGVTFTWGSNATGVATVSQTGLVTAVAAGSASITASAQGQSGSATIVVTSGGGGGGGGTVASISIQPPTATIPINGTQLVTATPLDSAGQLVTATVGWSASNSKATVTVNPTNSNAATITGAAVGVDTITATSGIASAKVIVTVTAVPIGTITITPSGQTLDAAGATVQLVAQVTDSTGQTLTGVPLTWTSSNTAIARVDSNGFLTTALIAGNVDITAAAGGKSGSASFSVVLRWRDIATSNGLTTDSLGHTCGVTVLKVAYCWGFNGLGQAGIGSNVSWNGPQAVIGSIAFTSIATGSLHTCGINDQGAAYCWGSNGAGQLGIGTNAAQAFIPTLVTGGLTFDTTSISAGRAHSCALTTTGVAYCWGAGAAGQLGNGGNSPSNAPVAVSGGLTFSQISAGAAHTCGVTTGGLGYCWGDNTDGQLGDGTNSPSNVPVAVTGGLTFTEIAAGGGHSCGVASTGNIYCWGLNSDGQLGKADFSNVNAPAAIFGGQTYSAVDAGAQSTCAILAGGGAGPSGKCWGGNLGYQIGNGDTVSVATYVTPAAILAPTASRITTGSRHACIVTTTKLVYCWGRNREGQAGIGIFAAATLPNIAIPAKVIGQP